MRKDVCPNISAAFPFSRKESNPFQLPVLSVMVAMVFDVVPDAKGSLEQFIPDILSIVQYLLVSAKFDPPEIASVGSQRMVAMRAMMLVVSDGGEGFIIIDLGEIGGDEIHLIVGLP